MQFSELDVISHITAPHQLIDLKNWYLRLSPLMAFC
jgi:hypothetical protein